MAAQIRIELGRCEIEGIHQNGLEKQLHHAYFLLLRNDLVNVRTLCEDILHHHPGQPKALRYLASTYLGEGAFELAEQAYRQSLSSDPLQDATYNNLGIACYHQKKYEDAVRGDVPVDVEIRSEVGVALLEP